MLKFRNTTEQFQRVLIQSSIHSFNGKGQEQMCMTAFKTPIKKQNLDFLERLLLKLERISSQRAINKLLKVFGKIATFKMKILMIFRKLMPAFHMLLSQYNNTKNFLILNSLHFYLNCYFLKYFNHCINRSFSYIWRQRNH